MFHKTRTTGVFPFPCSMSDLQGIPKDTSVVDDAIPDLDQSSLSATRDVKASASSETSSGTSAPAQVSQARSSSPPAPPSEPYEDFLRHDPDPAPSLRASCLPLCLTSALWWGTGYPIPFHRTPGQTFVCWQDFSQVWWPYYQHIATSSLLSMCHHILLSNSRCLRLRGQDCSLLHPQGLSRSPGAMSSLIRSSNLQDLGVLLRHSLHHLLALSWLSHDTASYRTFHTVA